MLRQAEADYGVSTKALEPGPARTVAIRRGWVLRYLPVLDHMRRSIWPNPHVFDPKRFAQPLTPEQRKSYHPFGFGPQGCPGQSLAIIECILILQAFFERFDLAPSMQAQAAAPVRRNVLHTNRPVGVTARISAADLHAHGHPSEPSCRQGR